MKIPKIVRPEIELEYIGVIGFIDALCSICRLGIQKTHIDYQIKTLTTQTHGVEGGKVKRYYFYIIPKYKLKRVSELSEDDPE